jgi:hypothetical protein
LKYERKNFLAEIGVDAWFGVIAQRGANSNAYSEADAVLFFCF